jgi:methyl acetate hydrolase
MSIKHQLLTGLLGILLFTLPTAFAQGTSNTSTARPADPLESKLNAVLGSFTDSKALPGVVAGLANARETLYQGASGWRNIASAEPMQQDTIIAIASMTKPVTTVAVLQLVDRGLLDLDLPASHYLPQLAALQLLAGFDANGNPRLTKPPRIPTTRELLSHTSGYAYEFWNENIHRAVDNGLVTSLFVPGQAGLQAPLAFAPGARWDYGIGIDWAGRLVEKLSGKPLDRYFHDHIFTPLQMHDTFYFVPEDKQARLASAYVETDNGFEVSPPLVPEVSGGGGLYSTVADYLRFMRALLNQGRLEGAQILTSASVEAMFENQIGDIPVTPLATQVPAASNDFDMGFGAPAHWGLGFLLHQTGTASGRPAGTASWAGLFNSYFWIDRKNGICAIVATQVLPFYDADAVKLLKSYEAAIYGEIQ